MLKKLLDLNALKTYSKNDIFEQIDASQYRIAALRPFDKEQEARILQKFRLDWNYHSNAIEGNSLTYGETVALLMHGVTAKGKPLKDHLDIKGHNEAIDFLMQIIKHDRPLSEGDIRELHKLLLIENYEANAITADGLPTTKIIEVGKYKTTSNHVQTKTGEIHYYASPEEVPILMNELVDWYNQAISDEAINPIVIAALFHHRFVAIHPFGDGNGRMTRLLMNLILMRRGFPIVVIKQSDRDKYYGALSQADNGEYLSFIEFIANETLYALDIQFRGAKGEDISSEDDFEKELFLLEKTQKGDNHFLELEYSAENLKVAFEKSIIPLFDSVGKKVKVAAKLFLEYDFGYYDRLYKKTDLKKLNMYFFNSTLDNPKNLELVLSDKIQEKHFTLVHILKKYKNISNPFFLDLNLHINYTDSYFNILFLVEKKEIISNYTASALLTDVEKNIPLFSRLPYHKPLTETQITDATKVITTKLLQEIKKHSGQ